MQRQRKELNFKGENIYVGIDVHLKSWYVSILTEHIEHKRFRQDPQAEILAKYLHTHFPGGSYYSVYEAGFSGFSAHYKLTALGIKNIVVNAADVPTSHKEQEQKSDPVDASKLARSLRNGELRCIHIHRPETLRDRSLLRTRSSLVKDMTRIKNRIKGMLYYYGVSVPSEFASKGKRTFPDKNRRTLSFCRHHRYPLFLYPRAKHLSLHKTRKTLSGRLFLR
jgi:transposase